MSNPVKPVIDSHCHYNLEPLYSDWETYWQAATAAGIAASVVVGTNAETSQRAVDIASREAKLFATIGFHPVTWQEELERLVGEQDLAERPDPSQYLESLEGQLPKLFSVLDDQSQSAKIVAIGEIGLDYFRIPSHLPGLFNPLTKTAFSKKELKEFIKDLQQRTLRKQLALVTEANRTRKIPLPVILHVRDQTTPNEPTSGNAYWDTLSITSEFPDLQYILHCVSGPLAYVTAMVQQGAYVGVAANVTYPNSNQLRSLIAQVPVDQILLETDAPYLAPQSYRGQVCEPAMIRETAAYLTDYFSLNLDVIAQNTIDCFYLDPSLIQ